MSLNESGREQDTVCLKRSGTFLLSPSFRTIFPDVTCSFSSMLFSNCLVLLGRYSNFVLVSISKNETLSELVEIKFVQFLSQVKV